VSRTILVHGEAEKFQIEVPDDAELTFGPWSPPTKEDRGFRHEEQRRGTLRVYDKGKKQILAVFAGVVSFRDVSQISYQREVVQLKGQTTTIWESDDGTSKASSSTDERRSRRWVRDPELERLAEENPE